VSESRQMDLEEFGRLFSEFGHSAFRLETLSKYSIADEQAEFDAFVRGEDPPPSMLSREWLTTLREATAAGKTFSRVHAIQDDLTSHLKYQIEWGYTQNAAAGDEIGILQDADPKRHFQGLPYEDFWLFDDTTVVRVHYDGAGHFLGATKVTEPKEVEPYKKARDIAVKLATPLAKYRQAHKAELSQRGGREASSPARREASGAKSDRPSPPRAGVTVEL
jgi:Family of unknown function (DUF6879)